MSPDHLRFRKGDLEILKWKQEPKNAQLTSLVLIYGKGFSDKVYIRGGFSSETVKNDNGIGFHNEERGVSIDSIGSIRYTRLVNTSRATFERTDEYQGYGKTRTFPCSQDDYVYYKPKAILAVTRGEKYLKKMMEEFSKRAEILTSIPVERFDPKVWGYYSLSALCEMCGEYGWNTSKKSGRMLCSKHLEEEKK